ncbi:MAG: 30S ribosomal protein S3 [Gammaproteobacteria bacterium]
MGQKVNPTGMRLGIVKPWDSTWYANKEFADVLFGDIQARKFLQRRLASAAISRIQIERPAPTARMTVTIHAARPGNIIGKKGDEIEKVKAELSRIVKVPVNINIQEVRKPDLDAKLVAENIAQQLEKRIMFRRAMKRAVQSALKQGAEGIKIMVAGRLGGAEIARTEWYREGRVPLHTLRANIDYATAEAKTTYGIIGIKVWIFKGEILGNNEQEVAQHDAAKTD